MKDQSTPRPWAAERTNAGEFLLVCRDGGRRDGQAIGLIYRQCDVEPILHAINYPNGDCPSKEDENA